ncbi:MAG: hypothetical protein IKX21_04820, partial [Deltaproteobacteria bacterium]|nr:hypothetical protein [Deltaproteobacteria bacterium]
MGASFIGCGIVAQASNAGQAGGRCCRSNAATNTTGINRPQANIAGDEMQTMRVCGKKALLRLP